MGDEYADLWQYASERFNECSRTERRAVAPWKLALALTQFFADVSRRETRRRSLADGVAMAKRKAWAGVDKYGGHRIIDWSDVDAALDEATR